MADHWGNEYPKFDFYDYKGSASKESTECYMQYLEVNKIMQEKRLKEQAEQKFSQMAINDDNQPSLSMLKDLKIPSYAGIVEVSKLR